MLRREEREEIGVLEVSSLTRGVMEESRTRKFMELRMSESVVFRLIRDRKSRGASGW